MIASVRGTLQTACAPICALLLTLTATAQPNPIPAYPTKPIKIVVPYATGGTSDVLARLLGQKLTDAWGQIVIVENKAGASGNIGADFVAKAAADGYTLLLADIGTLAIAPSVYPALPFDPVKDFAPVSMVAYSPHILVVHPSVKASNVKELIEYAKANQGKMNYATSGVGGANHLAGVEFANRTGVQWVYVPYKGGAQAIADVAGGQSNVMFNGMLATYPHVKSGNLKIIAVSGATRMSSIPDVPTVAESGVPGFETGSWQGVLAPAGTPAAIIEKLNGELARILNSSDMKEKLAAQGAEARTNSPEVFGGFISKEKERWAKVVKGAGIKIE